MIRYIGIDRSGISRFAWRDTPLHHCTREQLIAAIEDLHRNLNRTRAERDKAQLDAAQLTVMLFRLTNAEPVL